MPKMLFLALDNLLLY